MREAVDQPSTAESIRRGALAALIVVVGSLGLEMAYGVALGDAILYVGYELLFVVIPGWLTYRALSPRVGSVLRQLTMGWALGYVLEVLAFMLTAATDTRGLFVAYPLTIAAAATIVRRRTAVPSTGIVSHLPGRLIWLLVAVSLAAVTYFAIAYFPGAPLPGTKSVTYYLDYPRWISLAADAKNHWPIQDPSVSGEPLPYHYFVNIHLAAASQVTGLGLPLVYFRLFVFPLVLLLVLELVLAGQSFARSAYVGLTAACLALFVGQIRLDARNTFLAHTPFLGLFFTFLLRSPSFLFGLVILLPLMTLLGEIFADRGGRPRLGDWLLVVLFMVGASDAKITILPLVLVALILYAGWTRLVERRIRTAVSVAAALTLLVFGAVYVMQYRGHSSRTGIHPFAAFDGMSGVALIKDDLMRALPAFPGKTTLLSVGGVLIGAFGLLAGQLVGLAWIVRRQGHRLRPGHAWLSSLVVAGVLLSITLNEPGSVSALYFVFYGLVAGYILSAEGLRIAWQSRPPLSRQRMRIAAIALSSLVVIAALMGAPSWLHLFAGPHSDPHRYLFWYGGLLVFLLLLYAVARKWLGPTRWPAAALVCGAVLTVGALDTPLDSLVPTLANPGLAAHNFGKPLTPELYRALTWIRDETPTDSVIAVNNQWIDPANKASFEFDYSAFSERRVFLEGWGYSQRVVELGYAKVAQGIDPFVGRLRLNEAAFIRGSRGALRTMAQRYGVRYLVVDELNGYRSDVQMLGRVAREVYRAPGVLVFELR
jgi:hypothetical protein